MKKKVVLMTVIGLIILIAVVAAALNAVFTVTKVEVNWSVCSDEGEAEAVSLQKDLEESCLGKSTTFLKLEDVRTTVNRYPYFELTSAKKSYPQKIVLSVTERKEVFSFRRENGLYAVLDANGSFLYDKETNANRTGGENILLDGFQLSANATGDAASGKYMKEILTLSSVFAGEFDNIRANIVSVTLLNHYMEGDYFRVQMQEGVYFDLYTPENNTENKAIAAMEKYVSLSYEEKLYGYFDLMDRLDNPDEFTVGQHYPVPETDS